jgi:NodT family efflux transporter outer membrane factor (OMF) lipoprotein
MTADRVRRRAGPAIQPSLAVALFAACLAGCADLAGPAFQRPDSPEKAAWSGPGARVSASETIAPDWWQAFRDPTLDALVSQAIAGNFDLKVLAARTQVAAALIGEAKAGGMPIVDVGAGAIFEKSTGRKTSQRYDLGTQVSWELDIWGKFEKGVQAQTAEFRATEADWRAGYLTLVAAVSTTYFQILQLDEQIGEQRRALRTNREILAIYEAQLAHGVAPRTQVVRQRAEINRLTDGLLELQRARDLAENALATLTGVPAGEQKLPVGRLRDRVHEPEVPAGLPSQLLARRPDIVAAEYRVLQGYGLAGQAKLAQLPSISLTGRAGTASLALGDLMKSFTLSFLPSINFPLFDPGIKARIKTTDAQTGAAEAEYRRTVMVAFEEVENALTSLAARKQQRAELAEQTGHLKVVAAEVRAQLKAGVVSQLEVFETERQLLAAELALLANHQQILADTVTLYKVLGGGWPPVDVRNDSGDARSESK